MQQESRFLVDPGGFEDLARALTVAYTPYHADNALGRPARLLNMRTDRAQLRGIPRLGLAEELGIERYRAAISWLRQQLAWFEFDEAVPPTTSTSNPFFPAMRRRPPPHERCAPSERGGPPGRCVARLPLGNAGARTLIRRISNWGNR